MLRAMYPGHCGYKSETGHHEEPQGELFTHQGNGWRVLSREGHTPLEMFRAMYPGHCGYMSETGGIMKNLRESCSNTKVRDGEGYQGRATHI